MSRVVIDVLDDEPTRQLWAGVGTLVELLPERWVLIGGLMVQLHALEHGITDVRPTRDIDVLGEARPQGTLDSIDATLRRAGFELIISDLDGYAHRYERDALRVDVLAPEGIKPPRGSGAACRRSACRAAPKLFGERNRSPWSFSDARSSYVDQRCSARC